VKAVGAAPENTMSVMTKISYLLLAAFIALSGAALNPAARADGLAVISRSDPEVMLKQATDQLLAISKAARDYVDSDRERYYSEVAAVLDQVMDINYFARGVMATYASARVYKSLPTEAEKQAFRERVARFAVALKRVWMVKYADALLKADGERIELARVNTADDGGDRASVNQTITDKKNQTYLVQYSLHKLKDGSWMIANVVVEGVNLGQTYRSQFAEAVENHGGDVDYVVDNWVELMLHQDTPELDKPAGDTQ
jgi:phospholipid transport system substrate-binding protein